MATIKRTIPIESTAAAAWNILADLEGVGRWLPIVASASVQGNKLGAVRSCDLGEQGRLEETFTEWREGSGLAFEVAGDFPLRNGKAVWTIEEADGQAVLVYALTHDGPLPGAPDNAAELVEGMVDFVTGAFKHFVETGEQVTVDAAS